MSLLPASEPPGRVDFVGIPILFEDLSFDSTIQKILVKNKLEIPAELQTKCFGPGKDLPLPQNREYIFNTFQTEATQTSTWANLSDKIRSLGAASACLKVFSEAPRPTEGIGL